MASIEASIEVARKEDQRHLAIKTSEWETSMRAAKSWAAPSRAPQRNMNMEHWANLRWQALEAKDLLDKCSRAMEQLREKAGEQLPTPDREADLTTIRLLEKTYEEEADKRVDSTQTRPTSQSRGPQPPRPNSSSPQRQGFTPGPSQSSGPRDRSRNRPSSSRSRTPPGKKPDKGKGKSSEYYPQPRQGRHSHGSLNRFRDSSSSEDKF